MLPLVCILTPSSDRIFPFMRITSNMSSAAVNCEHHFFLFWLAEFLMGGTVDLTRLITVSTAERGRAEGEKFLCTSVECVKCLHAVELIC